MTSLSLETSSQGLSSAHFNHQFSQLVTELFASYKKQQVARLAFYSSAPQLIRRDHEDTSLPFVDVYVFGNIFGWSEAGAFVLFSSGWRSKSEIVLEY